MTPAEKATAQRDLLVNAEQIRALYTQLPKSTAGMVAGSLVLHALYRPKAERQRA